MIPINGNAPAIPTFDNVNSTPKSAAGAASKPVDSPEEQKLKKAAGDFESILLASMWKSMKSTFSSDDTSSDPAHGTLEDWGIEIMSGAVGKAGALGIGNLLLKHLEPTLEKHSDGSTGSAAPQTPGGGTGTPQAPDVS